jgi:hypothetical protein
VACSPVDLTGPIPAIDLVTADGVHRGQPYASTWGGAAVGPAGGDALIPGTPTTASAGEPLTILIGGDVCAVNWYIAYGALPPDGPAPWKFMPIAELVPTVAQNRDPAHASQNRFALSPLPPGDWLVGVELGFSGGQELVWFRVATA